MKYTVDGQSTNVVTEREAGESEQNLGENQEWGAVNRKSH